MIPAQFHKGAGLMGTVESAKVVETVVKLYVSSGYSTRRIAQDLDIDRQRVEHILHREGIEVAQRGAGRNRPLKIECPISESALRYLYVDLQMSSVEIGRALGISDRFLRSRMKLWGIERRTRGKWNRTDRVDVELQDLRDLYLHKEWAASSVGEELGVSGNQILRSAHSSGLPVRAGGSHRPPEYFDIQLIEALYDDEQVSCALVAFGIPAVREPGPIWHRFPKPVELNKEVLQTLYTDCGLSCFHIELVTGVAAPTVLNRLEDLGIVRRGRGGRSPFMQRWRARQRPRKDTTTKTTT